MNPSPAPESRFSDRVENYIRYRPGYPQEVIALLRAEAGLTAQSVVADIGSGTGISAELLLREGCTVHAVEPNRDMREAAERLLAAYPGFRSVDGRAQETTLAEGSVDLVAAAQAFHWFDTAETRAEFARILRPGGWVVLMWNERLTDTTPFLRGYEELLLRHATDYAAVRHENIDAAALARFFGGPFATDTFPNFQEFDFAGLAGRLLSSSYAPAPGHPRHDAMMQELRTLFEACAENGKVRFDYRTSVHTGRLSA
jgi:SAM-dependent methyltransferase